MATTDVRITRRERSTTLGAVTLDDGTEVRFAAQTDATGVAVTGLRLSIAEGGSITSATLRAVPVGRIAAAVTTQADSADNQRGDGAQVGTRDEYRIEGAKARGRKGKPEGFYERVAEVYLAASALTYSPHKVIAEANDVPIETSRSWVHEARRRGLLTSGMNGRAG